LRDIEAGTAVLNLTSSVVHLAAEIADFEPGLDDEEYIGLILLIVLSLAALEEGSTRFPVTGPESVVPMRRVLTSLCGEAFGNEGPERMAQTIARMLDSNVAPQVIGTRPDDYKPLIYLAPFIYQHRILAAEIAFARRLAVLMNARPAGSTDAGLEAAANVTFQPWSLIPGPLKLSEEQRAAIECAVREPLTIISGGPGTGKTSIVLAILRVLAGVGVNPMQIALAAPTGKAAYRIGESIRERQADESGQLSLFEGHSEPTTLHRLLGYSPTRRRFRYHRNNPLDARVVIVDEGSMVDLGLMSRLLDALRPDARLILLGDADQLPSVSAGTVFRDLLPPANEPGAPLARNCVRLTRSFRANEEAGNGRAIVRLAKAINLGKKDVLAPSEGEIALTRRDSADELEFAGTEWLDQESAIGAFLERWYSTQICAESDIRDLENRAFTSLEDGFMPADCDTIRRIVENVARARVLCITRVLDSGSQRMNSVLHRRVAHDREIAGDRDRFIAGEPVMVLRNDYARTLFNGDQGVVLRVRRAGLEPTLMAVFPRRDNFVPFPIDALGNHLELCYAMTVHKAQGSEFDSVAVIMPKNDIPIMTREILYTAVSRARKSVILVGSKTVIEAGLARKVERYSGVPEHFAQYLNQSDRA
jgi:exodeoxyribonuclease V alpha subunit